MGASGKWLKSLITLKKLPGNDHVSLLLPSLLPFLFSLFLSVFYQFCFWLSGLFQEKVGDKSKKRWRLWRSSSEGFGSSMKVSVKKGQSKASEESSCPFVANDAYAAAVAAVVRAPPEDFRMIKQEWAAIRIQTVFRGFLVSRSILLFACLVPFKLFVSPWLSCLDCL